MPTLTPVEYNPFAVEGAQAFDDPSAYRGASPPNAAPVGNDLITGYVTPPSTDDLAGLAAKMVEPIPPSNSARVGEARRSGRDLMDRGPARQPTQAEIVALQRLLLGR